MHSGIVLREDPALFGELFAELADAYVEQALFADALGIYSVLLDADQVRPIYLCMWRVPFMMVVGRSPSRSRCKRVYATSDLASSKKHRTSLNAVRTNYQPQILSNGLFTGPFHAVVNVNPDFRDAKMRLAEVYEVQGEPAKALELVRESTPFLHRSNWRHGSPKTQSSIPDVRARLRPHHGSPDKNSSMRPGKSTTTPTKRNVALSEKSGCGARPQRRCSFGTCLSTLTNSKVWISKTKSGSTGGSQRLACWWTTLGNAGNCSRSIG